MPWLFAPGCLQICCDELQEEVLFTHAMVVHTRLPPIVFVMSSKEVLCSHAAAVPAGLPPMVPFKVAICW